MTDKYDEIAASLCQEMLVVHYKLGGKCECGSIASAIRQATSEANMDLAHEEALAVEGARAHIRLFNRLGEAERERDGWKRDHDHEKKEADELAAEARDLERRLSESEAAREEEVAKYLGERDEALAKWHSHQKNVPCAGCEGGHDTFWKSVIESPQWRAWSDGQGSPGWDVWECEGCGHISQAHFQAFLKFVSESRASALEREIAERDRLASVGFDDLQYPTRERMRQEIVRLRADLEQYKLTPEEEAEGDRLVKLSPDQIDKELRDLGYDPDQLKLKGEVLARALFERRDWKEKAEAAQSEVEGWAENRDALLDRVGALEGAVKVKDTALLSAINSMRGCIRIPDHDGLHEGAVGIVQDAIEKPLKFFCNHGKIDCPKCQPPGN